MTNITPERRAEIQASAELLLANNCSPHFPIGPAHCSIAEILALLDIADERDRLAARAKEISEERNDERDYVQQMDARAGSYLVRATAAEATARRLAETLKTLEQWCEAERYLLGAVDGYDYDSGQEYGLRRAEIEIRKALSTPEVKALVETGT